MGQPAVNQREKFVFPMFRVEHINFLARLTLGQPAVCPRAIWTLTRAKSLCLCAFFVVVQAFFTTKKKREGQGQLRPEGRNRRGETQLRGPEVLGPLRGLGLRPLVSVIRGLGNPFPELRHYLPVQRQILKTYATCLRKLWKICARGGPERSLKICAKHVRGHQKMCRDCAKFVRRNSRTIFGGELPRICLHKFLHIFRTRLELFSKTKLHRQINSQSQRPLRAPERLSGPRGRLFRGLGEGCPFSTEREKKVGHSEKRPRFPRIPPEGVPTLGFLPSGHR